jgi:hypothetical protein
MEKSEVDVHALLPDVRSGVHNLLIETGSLSVVLRDRDALRERHYNDLEL